MVPIRMFASRVLEVLEESFRLTRVLARAINVGHKSADNERAMEACGGHGLHRLGETSRCPA